MATMTSADVASWETGGVPDELLTTAEAAKALHVSPATLQRWVTAGIARPTLRLPGGGFRWDLDDLKQQLASRDGSEGE